VPALAPEPEAPVANDRLVKDPAAQAAADDAARQRRKDRQITAIVVGGVGVVALGVGTFFGVDALGKTSDAKDAPYLCSDDGACPSPEGVALLEDARRSARTADLLIGAGIVAVGAGVALWFTAPHAPEEGAPAAGTSARLAPSVMPISMRQGRKPGALASTWCVPASTGRATPRVAPSTGLPSRRMARPFVVLPAASFTLMCARRASSACARFDARSARARSLSLPDFCAMPATSRQDAHALASRPVFS
jgi:serine/threonine-protein kinase